MKSALLCLMQYCHDSDYIVSSLKLKFKQEEIPMPPSVTVITTAFGRVERVEEWARRWLNQGVQCIVCDNGGGIPPDNPSGVSVLPFKENTGFGGGINRAVEAADSDIVLITNPDTLPTSESFLMSFTEKHKKNSLSAGSTVDTMGRTVHSTGIWPDLNWVRKQIVKPAESLWRDNRIDWLQGSLMMVYRDDYLKLGGFSDAYPLYFEDVDLCARSQKAGMEVNYEPSCRFMHDEGTGSSGSLSIRLSCYHWGLVEFFRNHRPEEYASARRLVLLKCLLRYLILVPFRPSAASGYMTGFRCILGRTPPPLPGRARG